jgi:ABC-type multidrug transport system ATPase subunit
LDEPTNGLDPQGIADIRNLILHLSRDLHKTVMVSSHLLSEMELIADSMLIIDKGKKVVEGRAHDLFDPAETVVELRTNDDAAAYDTLLQSPEKRFVINKRNDCILLKLHREEVPQMVKRLLQMNIDILSFNSKHSLEDYFLSLTSGNQHVEAFKN